MWNRVVQPSEKQCLFWITIPHYEGELRVGLGHISYANADNLQWRDDDRDRNRMIWDVNLPVMWYVRVTDRNHRWGQQPTFAFSEKEIGRSRTRDTSECTFSDIIPVSVTVSPSSTFERPLPTKQSIRALKLYCRKYNLWKDDENDDDDDSDLEDHQPPTRELVYSHASPRDRLHLDIPDIDVTGGADSDADSDHDHSESAATPPPRRRPVKRRRRPRTTVVHDSSDTEASDND